MRERIPGLDLLRASAIAMVVLYHALPLLILARPISSFWWLEGGRLGVDLFFVLSGFLIGEIILNTGGRMAEPRILAGFWIGRWLRTLPSYYLFLGLNIPLQRIFFPWPFGSWLQLAPYLCFAQNLLGAMPTFFLESWSLCVEEWFYLTMPLLIWAGLRAGVGFHRGFAGVLILMLLVPPALRWEAKGFVDSHRHIADAVVYRLDSIGWGIAAAFVQQTQKAAWRRSLGFLLAAGLALSATCYYLYVARPDLDGTWFSRVLLPTLTSFGFAMLLPWAASVRSLGGGWGERSISALARWSYSLYLVNIPASVLVFFLLERRLPRTYLSSMIAVAVYLIASVASSAALWRLFERPILRARAQVSLCREAMAARLMGAQNSP
ncbi:MAG TPA: acyltransferase [Opitutaceae bacterium]|nr:acyltransferase [Opitutaceae bacterium]